MTFLNYIYLYLAAAAFILSLLGFVFFRRQKISDLQKFVSKKMLSELTSTLSRFKLHIKILMFATALSLLFLALARPQWGFTIGEEKAFGVDIIFAVDTSKSMLAEDIKPNRLERAKLAITDLVERLESDRIGIVAFSGQAFLQCPLTLDYGVFRMSLDALDTGIIQRGGTNIAAAISEAEAAFANSRNEKIIVLISDGEELEASGVDRAKRIFKEKSVKIYTLGVGLANGEPIPFRDKSGRQIFIKDESGNVVASRLNEAVLSQIAEAAGGFYSALSDEGMDAIFSKGINPAKRDEIAAKMKRRPIERFQIPLALALILLSLEAVVGTKKFFRTLPIFRAFFSLMALGAFISPQLKAAEEIKDARIIYNDAIALFDDEKLAEAKDNFYKAISASSDLKLHANAFYDIGAIDYALAKKDAENIANIAEGKNKISQALEQSAGILTQGNQTLQKGQGVLEMFGEKGLKDQNLQNEIKQSISLCENSKKDLDESEKNTSKIMSNIKQVSTLAENARKNFDNASELSPQMEKSNQASLSAKNALEKLNENHTLFSQLQIQAQTNSKMLEPLIEELKKLVRDNENQNQDNKDNQQNQDKQNNKNNKQDKSQQDKNDKSQQNQNDNKQNSEDKKDSKDNKSDDKKDEQASENQKDDSSKKEENKENSKEQNAEENRKNKSEQTDKQSEEQAIENPQEKTAGETPQGSENKEQEALDYRANEGAMTRREAMQILNSITDSEKKLPMKGFGNQNQRYENAKYKDW